MFVPNFKILSPVAPEKSLTEKKTEKVYTHTNTVQINSKEAECSR